jgi:hypothetical protein
MMTLQRSIAALVAGVVLVTGSILCATGVVPLPHAHATHVNEPTAPITDLVLRVEHYGTNTQAPCDGSVFPFSDIRIETFVSFTTAPSEHFNQTVQFARILPGFVDQEWSQPWSHANVPPHPATNPWRTAYPGGNSYNVEPGKYRVRTILTTLESGQQFIRDCTFTVPEGASS